MYRLVCDPFNKRPLSEGKTPQCLERKEYPNVISCCTGYCWFSVIKMKGLVHTPTHTAMMKYTLYL